MQRQEFIDACIGLFERNGQKCTPEQAEKLYMLTERMLEVNKSMNLTAITDEKTVILRHYVDSLTVAEEIPHGARLIDVGCGAGFPTLPLAIFREDVLITALDGTAKRINYVAETARLLGLANVTAIAARAEELANTAEHRESYDVATARAVAALPVLCELCLPFVKVGGKMIAMKAQQASDEIELAKNCISICGGKLISKRSCDLVSADGNKEERNLVFIEKTQKTPKIYPRHFSKISKKPL